jgi:hypothetical protein
LEFGKQPEMSENVICLLSSSPDRGDQSATTANAIASIESTLKAKRFVEIELESSSDTELYVLLGVLNFFRAKETETHLNDAGSSIRRRLLELMLR